MTPQPSGARRDRRAAVLDWCDTDLCDEPTDFRRYLIPVSRKAHTNATVKDNGQTFAVIFRLKTEDIPLVHGILLTDLALPPFEHQG